MTIGRLRQLIANLPDDAFVVVEADDHRYRMASVEAGTMIRVKVSMRSHVLIEDVWRLDTSEEQLQEQSGGRREPALIIT